jgi:Mrp family chromosome partitioning ATPase
MGSPIPPVVRSGSSGSSWPPSSPGTNARPAGSTYSYVTDRPDGPRPPATPPYYSEPKQVRDVTLGRGANRTPRPPIITEATSGERARILAQGVRSGWAPDPSIDMYARRALADQIFPLAVERCFVVGVVATPEARAHKTRVAAELAFALAEAGHPRVLLLEADFQWPAVHQLLHLDMPIAQGLSQQLRARAQRSSDPWTVMECTPTLHVLAEGIIRSPGTILTVQFDKGLKQLRTYYDVVVLDGPDTSAHAECNALSTVVDGLVSVEALGGASDSARIAELFPTARFTATVSV